MLADHDIADVIEIFDQTTGARVGKCGSGYQCSAYVSQSSPTTHCYIAYIARAGATNPPPDIQYSTNTVCVSWLNHLALSGFPDTDQVGLTAGSLIDVTSPNPYYIEVFDQTTGSKVAFCWQGTRCPETGAQMVPQKGGTTHCYIAYVAAWGLTNPPPKIQDTSNVVCLTASSPPK